MVVPLVVAGAMVAAPIISGLMGQAAAARDKKEQKKLIDQAKAEIAKVAPPDPESQKMVFDTLRSQGVLTPELETAFPELTSSVEGITVDPTLRSAQNKALQSLMTQGETGLNLEDRAALADIQSQAAQQERGQRQAILQGMQRRGVSGSGMELAAQLEAQQAGADRVSREQLGVAAQEQQRRLQALQAAGQMGGQMEGQQFNQDMSKAQALDAIKKFNMANSMDMQQRNIAEQRRVQAANLENQQRIADANVGLRNQNQQYNRNAVQTGYDNQMQKAGAMAGAITRQGNLAGERAQQTANQYAQGGSAVGQGIGAYAQYQNQQDQNDMLKKYLENQGGE